MPTEEQLLSDSNGALFAPNEKRGGQRLVIANRIVTKLRFGLWKFGNPSGNISFTIRKVSNDDLIQSVVWGNASSLSTSQAWKEATFVGPSVINEEVRILVEFGGGSGSDIVFYAVQNSNVKADEYFTYYTSTSWTDVPSKDATYVYTYEEPAEPAGVGGQANLVAAGII